MRNAIIFSLVGSWMCYTCVTADSLLLTILSANATLTFLGVAIAFGLRRPEIFMKSPNGRVHILSYLLFWPYFLMNHGVLALYRLLSREKPLHEILPGLYLGRRLWSCEQKLLTQRNVGTVIDMTAEWSEASFMRHSCAYLNVPVLDMCPPTLTQVRQAVMQIERALPQQGVFVHCAAGHGRSATLVAAYLLYAGMVADVQEAMTFIKTKRSRIHVNREQSAVLHHYHQELQCEGNRRRAS